MPSTPISSMTTLVIPLFFVLAVLTAPPVAAEPREVVGPNTAALIGGPPRNEPVLGACTGSFCGLVRPAPLRVTDGVRASAPPHVPRVCAPFGSSGLVESSNAADCHLEPFAISPLDPEFCEYVGPAPFFMSPSDSECCGLVSPAPLALPNK
ncbi:hypothetical protein ACIA8C_28535 [Nocardia sp. NPDC051321]|uniref:hypothetical protein n=1 Tax=Nocardia sp. NPDC051321 TaxID=3364323 RepID=UPI0037BAC3F7